MRESILDTAMYCMLALLLVFVGAAALTIGDYNAFHVFVDPEVRGFGEWCDHMAANRGQVLAFVRLYWLHDMGWSAFAIAAMLFAAPALAIPLLWGQPRRQRDVLIMLALVTLPDLLFCLLFEGPGPDTKGYDGGEGFMLRMLHCLFGVLAMSYALGCTAKRWFGRLFRHPARRQ